MKRKNVLLLVLSVLEGMLSGVYFYLGQRDENPLDIFTGSLWLAMSFFHGLMSAEREDDCSTDLEEDFGDGELPF